MQMRERPTQGGHSSSCGRGAVAVLVFTVSPPLHPGVAECKSDDAAGIRNGEEYIIQDVN